MPKRFFTVTLFIFCLSAAGFAQDLKVNNKEVSQGQELNLFYDDLDAGKIPFSRNSAKLKKAEVTFDKGRTWEEMELEGSQFTYAYRPPADETVIPEFLLTAEDGSITTERPNIRINYRRQKPDDAVEAVLEKMKDFYEQESIDRFMNVFSYSYPDRVKFQEAIQNDFYNYKNIRLFYRIDRRTFESDFEGAIWDVYWERNADSRTGDSFNDTANISMRFDKEGGAWLISGLRNNTIFGSSLLANPDLAVSSSDIALSGAVVTNYNITINVNVHNNGSAAANNVVVKYYGKRPLTDPDYVDLSMDKTVTIINAGSTGSPATLVWDTGILTAGTYYVKVVVDPNNAINEDDETNNTAINTIVK